MEFTTAIELGGKTATGFAVPADVMTSLTSSKRASVVVTINAHTYRSTVFFRDGTYLVPLSAENREAAGVAAGDEVTVDLALDDAPRTVELPSDLDAALTPAAREFYDALSFTYRKEWVRWIEDAKKPETRAARVEKTVTGLEAGKKTH